MNHSVGHFRSPAQTFQVFKLASMHRGASGNERLSARICAGKAQHLVARLNKILHNGGADKAGSACNKDSHLDFSFTSIHNQGRIWPLFFSS